MSTVVHLNKYKSKGTLQAVRELLVLAMKGKIAGLHFDAELTDGSRRTGVTGKFSAPAPLSNVRSSQ